MRRTCVRVALLITFGLVAGFPSEAGAQTVAWYRFDPPVIPSTFNQPIRLEAAVSGSPTRVSLDLDAGGTIELRDDGTGGDRQANDGVFTAGIDAASVLRALRPDDVHRVFVGFLNVFNGSTRVLRGNMFADVLTPDIPTPEIRQLAPDVQATARIVNIVDPQYLADSNVRRIAQTFYRWYGDSFDFLNIISTPERFLNRTHTNVRNDVSGIGLALNDNSAQYGSSGRLRGYTVFPIPGFYDGAEDGYSHETGHQWINFLGFAPFASGIPHWPVSSMATGTMGFSIGGSGGEGGDFRCNIVDDGITVKLVPVSTADSPVFNDFDLYLMGMLPAESAHPQIVLSGVTSAPSCNGQTYTGGVTRVGVDAIVAGAGRRVPDASAAPKDFRAATIFVSRDGLVTPETMTLYSWLTERVELRAPTPIHSGFVKANGNPFFVQTRGLGTISSLLTSDPDFSLRVAQAAVTVTRGATATFTISALPTTAGFNRPISFTCGTLIAPLTCTFSPPQVTPGNIGADVLLSVMTGPASVAHTFRAMGALFGLSILSLVASRGRRFVPAACVALACAAASCGGHGPSPSPPSNPSPPTPPGSGTTVYSITVTATSGALRHTAVLTLTVQ